MYLKNFPIGLSFFNLSNFYETDLLLDKYRSNVYMKQL